MHPNYGNYYENYDQRKTMVTPVFHSAPPINSMTENYYQRPPQSNSSYNEQPYYDMKYASQAPPPAYPSYNPNPNVGNVNLPPQPSASYPYGNQTAPREDVSFYLHSYETYFQQQGKCFISFFSIKIQFLLQVYIITLPIKETLILLLIIIPIIIVIIMV